MNVGVWKRLERTDDRFSFFFLSRRAKRGQTRTNTNKRDERTSLPALHNFSTIETTTELQRSWSTNGGCGFRITREADNRWTSLSSCFRALRRDSLLSSKIYNEFRVSSFDDGYREHLARNGTQTRSLHGFLRVNGSRNTGTNFTQDFWTVNSSVDTQGESFTIKVTNELPKEYPHPAMFNFFFFFLSCTLDDLRWNFSKHKLHSKEIALAVGCVRKVTEACKV